MSSGEMAANYAAGKYWKHRRSQSWRRNEYKPQRNNEWSLFRVNRSRRFLLLAVLCLVLVGGWRFQHSNLETRRHHILRQSEVDSSLTGEKRSIREAKPADIEEQHPTYEPALVIIDSVHQGPAIPQAQNAISEDLGSVPELLPPVRHRAKSGFKLKHDTRPVKDAAVKPQDQEKHIAPEDDYVVDVQAATVTKDTPTSTGLILKNDQGISRTVEATSDPTHSFANLPKGPVNVQPELNPETEKRPVISMPDQAQKEKIIETEPEAHLALEEKADSLPEIIHIPFEEAVRDEVLDGWEDEWVSHAAYEPKKWGPLKEPKIDFVYLWVNGSEEAFQDAKRPYELNSVLNDPEGTWITSHGVNRYRDWDELRYSIRSIEKHASAFSNKIQIIVNSVPGTTAGKQVPSWLNHKKHTKQIIQILSQEEFFDTEKAPCLPTFNSLTIENQLFNTPSDTDLLFAMSDDMLLGRQHAASDIYSPLFGPVMGFKTNAYSTVDPPTEADAHRFGEKPYLIYTSWLLNRRFGVRKRRGQGHFGHSLSRRVMKEALGSFPGPELQSACKRFRGEPGFQLYSWYASFHYLIERHREALLWSYIMMRSDMDGDGRLSWKERQTIMEDLETGMKNEGKSTFRKRNYYHVNQILEKAGLDGPKVNTDILWTSLDGPAAIRDVECFEFDVNECLAPGFSISSTDERIANPIFSTAVVFDRIARRYPKCGDCLLKLILNKTPKGLSPLLPHAKYQPLKRELVVKALMRYRFSIINPDALFVMVTDAEQVDSTLTNRYVRQKKQVAGQLCLNDDVATTDPGELADVKQAMTELYQGLFPDKSSFEL